MEILRVTVSLVLLASSMALGCSDEFSPDLIRPSSNDVGAPPDAGIAPTDDAGAVPNDAAGGGLPEVAPVGPPMTGLHVVGNQILDAQGQTVVLHGVNRSGTEYKCVSGGGIFEGPSNEASI